MQLTLLILLFIAVINGIAGDTENKRHNSVIITAIIAALMAVLKIIGAY